MRRANRWRRRVESGAINGSHAGQATSASREGGARNIPALPAQAVPALMAATRAPEPALSNDILLPRHSYPLAVKARSQTSGINRSRTSQAKGDRQVNGQPAARASSASSAKQKPITTTATGIAGPCSSALASAPASAGGKL